ncbi:hypothetical protein FOA52_006865 [Chlamydomonas sp. UWO 241]|nr:hypothetical protein FOA52_006865 [Chlamydomonas sp. UWO 241]
MQLQAHVNYQAICQRPHATPHRPNLPLVVRVEVHPDLGEEKGVQKDIRTQHYAQVCAGLRGLEAAVPALWRVPLLNARNEPIWRLWRVSAAAASADEPQESSPHLHIASFDADDYGPGFTRRRLLVFFGIVAGYTGLYFTRGSLTYTAPVMLTDPSLSMTLTDVGVMTSAFPLAYGVSKFAGGVLGARFSAGLMLGGGLLLTAFVNLALGLCTSVPQFAGLWFLNGSLQGIGAPASAMLLTAWFASTERGTWWGLWNIGANVGGFVTPLLVGTVASAWGWQWGMWVPGFIGLSLALFSLAVVRDSPEEAGFSPDCAASFDEAYAPTPRVAAAAAAAAKHPVQDKGGGIRNAFSHVVANKGVWLLAFTYFFIYIIRQ